MQMESRERRKSRGLERRMDSRRLRWSVDPKEYGIWSVSLERHERDAERFEEEEVMRPPRRSTVASWERGRDASLSRRFAHGSVARGSRSPRKTARLQNRLSFLTCINLIILSVSYLVGRVAETGDIDSG